jgi:catechol 2,3-dioxygenase-like lactoylglutathione lyase family enzyme
MAPIIDHLGISVSDLARSKAFYAKALAPLGIELLREFEGRIAGFGKNRKPEFRIQTATPTPPLHIAFIASSRALVKAFYEAALAAGGRDNGPPGTRPMYHEHYFGAFVLDPDGYNIEAVCHEPYLG